MRKPSKRKLELLKQYIKALQEQFPDAHIEEMSEWGREADFWIRVKIAEDRIESVLDKTAELTYDWYVNYKITILASVSNADVIQVKI